MSEMIPTVIINNMPIRNRGYFEWIYTGLQIMHEKGEIELKHEGSSWDLFLRKHPRIYGKLEQKCPELCKLIFPVDHFSMFGRVESGDRIMRFAYDVTDSPFTYALAHLEVADLYFKTQCPIQFEEIGYPLSHTIRIPYHPAVLENKSKIKPAMSTGPITSTLNLKRNLKLLADYKAIDVNRKNIKIFASFGGDQGPPAWTSTEFPPAPHNYHNERSIVTRHQKGIQHPNEKRAEIVRILRSWNKEDVDARIWNTKDPSIQGDAFAWNDYLKRVSESVYNINVSGFRRSLPFRFLDSFQVGCGIATDTLGVKWYTKFDQDIEVVEFGDLGYESEENTNWDKIQHNLTSIYEKTDLTQDRSAEIRDNFEKKWHPNRLAEYFVEECLQQL